MPVLRMFVRDDPRANDTERNAALELEEEVGGKADTTGGEMQDSKFVETTFASTTWKPKTHVILRDLSKLLPVT